MQGFEKELFAAYLWKRKDHRTEGNLDADFKVSRFAKSVTLLAVFPAVHGDGDVGSVVLGHVGWASMVQNLVSITVMFEEA